MAPIEPYLNEVLSLPLLSEEEERSLLFDVWDNKPNLTDPVCYQKWKQAKDKLVCHNMRFVVQIAKRFKDRGVPVLDLINDGVAGMCKALERFDPSLYKIRFLSYAGHWIKQAMRNALRSEGTLLHIPGNMWDMIGKWRRACIRNNMLGEKAEEEEQLAVELGLKKQALYHLRLCLRSLRTPDTFVLSPVEVPLELIPADEEIVENDVLAILLSVFEELEDRDKQVLSLRFGFDGLGSRTLKEVGTELKVTKERIRQIERRAINRLLKLFSRRVYG